MRLCEPSVGEALNPRLYLADRIDGYNHRRPIDSVSSLESEDEADQVCCTLRMYSSAD